MLGARPRLCGLLAVGLTAVFLVVPFSVRGDELVVFETGGCPYCAAWDREVGNRYHRTVEGRRLPLRRVDLAGPRPQDLAHVSDIRYTPTFVVMVEGREAGRIVGYNGEDQFWGLLGRIIAALPRSAK